MSGEYMCDICQRNDLTMRDLRYQSLVSWCVGICKQCDANGRISMPEKHLWDRFHDWNEADRQRLEELQRLSKEKHGFDPKDGNWGFTSKDGMHCLTMRRVTEEKVEFVDIPVISEGEYKWLIRCTCCQHGSELCP